MNESAYTQLLRAADDDTYAEAPPEFDRSAAEKRFLDLASLVSELVGETSDVETFPHIQDASFHGQIRLPSSCLADQEPRTPGFNDYCAWIRTSNFGDFITVFDDDESVKADVFGVLKQLFEQLGYTYIPSRELRHPYAGSNPGVSGFSDWGHRYFDWI